MGPKVRPNSETCPLFGAVTKSRLVATRKRERHEGRSWRSLSALGKGHLPSAGAVD
jgi:hypothetical protein